MRDRGTDQELEFEHTVIARPGLITGRREETRLAQGLIHEVAGDFGKINAHWLKDAWAWDAQIMAKAAVANASKAEQGEIKDKIWVMARRDIVEGKALNDLEPPDEATPNLQNARGPSQTLLSDLALLLLANLLSWRLAEF